jgi:hypothetical protein
MRRIDNIPRKPSLGIGPYHDDEGWQHDQDRNPFGEEDIDTDSVPATGRDGQGGSR